MPEEKIQTSPHNSLTHLTSDFTQHTMSGTMGDLDAAKLQLHNTITALDQKELAHFVMQCIPTGFNGSVSRKIRLWTALKVLAREVPDCTSLGKPTWTFGSEEWAAGREKYLEEPRGKKISRSELEDLTEKFLKVQELNAQTFLPQEERKEQAPKPDGQQGSDHGESDRESTHESGHTGTSVEGESLETSTPHTIGSTTGAESNN
jgi:hypothetical protein